MSGIAKEPDPTTLIMTCACFERCDNEMLIEVFGGDGGEGSAEGTVLLRLDGTTSFVLRAKDARALRKALEGI